MVIIDNEVGGNLDMTGDGHIGGDNFSCDKDCIAQIKINKKSKKFHIYWAHKLTW